MLLGDGAGIGLVTLVTEVLAVGIVLIVVLTATVRTRRHRLVRRRTAAEELARPLLMQALAAEPGGPAGTAEPSRVRIEEWVGPYLDAMATGLAAKLRGGDRAALVRFLEGRGTLVRARSRTRSIGLRRRLQAVEMLGGLGDTSAVDDLVARLADTDGEVRRSAVRALGRTGSPEAVPALLALLDADADVQDRVPPHYVTLALLRIGTAGVGQLQVALRSHGPNGRAAAASVLGWLGETSAVPGLTRALDDAEVAVRAAAVEALGRIGLPTQMARMCDLLDVDQPEPVRVAAAQALGRLGDDRAAAALAALFTGSHLSRRTAAQALVRLGAPGREQLTGRGDLPEVREVLPTGDRSPRELSPA